MAFKLDLEWQQFLNNSDSAMNPMTTMPASSTNPKSNTKSNPKSTLKSKPNPKPTSTKPNPTEVRDLNDDDDETDEGEEDEDVPIIHECINEDSSTELTETTQPKCTPIYVSTKTKISYLTRPIDIHAVFWDIPVLKYATPKEGTIKKQMKLYLN